MKSDRGLFAIGILLLFLFLDSFSFDLPYVMSSGGAESGNLTIDYLHAINRKINLLIMLVVLCLLSR